MVDINPITLKFWQSATGREPVREWLSAMPIENRKIMGRDLAKLQFGWPLGMPLCKSLKDGLWELRSTLPDTTEARILFCFYEGELIALNGFIKKSQATPPSQLNLARQRKKELKQ